MNVNGRKRAHCSGGLGVYETYTRMYTRKYDKRVKNGVKK